MVQHQYYIWIMNESLGIRQSKILAVLGESKQRLTVLQFRSRIQGGKTKMRNIFKYQGKCSKSSKTSSFVLPKTNPHDVILESMQKKLLHHPHYRETSCMM